MKTSLVGVVVTLAVAFVPACGGISSSETEQPAAAGSSGKGGIGGSGGGTTTLCATCNQLEQCFNNQYCVAKLVPITGGYSIDATEVTRDQYAAWLATNPSIEGQVSACTWNGSYEPGPGLSPFGCDSEVWPPGAKGDHPVVCVDWCDAYTYCQGVGKRLCGKIGGGMNDYIDYINYASASTSQWYAACSSGGTNGYPYGDKYSGTTCNGSEAGHGTTVPVASKNGCQSSVSGYTGVYDLSGNVLEWEDSCNGNAASPYHCRLRGGSFLNNYDALRCGFDYINTIEGSNADNVGFRCCSSP